MHKMRSTRWQEAKKGGEKKKLKKPRQDIKKKTKKHRSQNGYAVAAFFFPFVRACICSLCLPLVLNQSNPAVNNATYCTPGMIPQFLNPLSCLTFPGVTGPVQAHIR